MHYNSTITLLKNSLFKTTLFYSLIFQRKSWINANWCNHIFSCQRLITVTNWAKFWNAFRMTTSSIGETSSRTLIILLSTLLMLESLKLSHFVEFGGQTDWRQKYQVCVQKYLLQVDKVQIFWKGHKNLFHLPLIVLSNHVMSEKRADDGANFCGPLRISELEGRRKGGLSYSQCARGIRVCLRLMTKKVLLTKSA